ncbi:Rpr2-domain-containing protein [Sparassis latifolia]
MGKKNKDQPPNVSLGSVTSRDIIQRINFLYQASAYLASISKSKNGKLLLHRGSKTDERQKGAKARHPASTAELSRSYIRSMRVIGQKTTVKLDPNIKRTLCRGCNVVLIPGSTVATRVKKSSSHGHTVVYTCTACNTTRRIPAPPVLEADGPADDATGMDTDSHNEQSTTPLGKDDVPKIKTKAKKRPVGRLPPLFQRRGHVVFRGNERLEEIQ